jgi:hypothetical protein
MNEIFTLNVKSEQRDLSEITYKLLSEIEKSKHLNQSEKSGATLALISLEDSLRTELKRATNLVDTRDALVAAKARPVLFAVGGTAAFVGAVLLSEPLYAGTVAYSTALGLGEGAGKVAATAMIAGLGAGGVDTVKDIAIPRWFAAGKDAQARDIPFGCALIKQNEIGKAEELHMILHSAAHGAMIGAGITGVTLVTPKILEFLGGKILTAYLKAPVKIPLLAATGSGLIRFSTVIDEIALIGVVGLVGIGGAYEGYNLVTSLQSGYSFGKLLKEIDVAIQTASVKNNQPLIQKLTALKNQAQAAQLGFYGDSAQHAIDVLVCGYLLEHMAAGAFMDAWRGGMNAVIENLVLASDDAPTGINASMSAAKKASVTGVKTTAISAKLGLLKAKLTMIVSGVTISPATNQSFHHYINMNNEELEGQLEDVETHLKELMAQN